MAFDPYTILLKPRVTERTYESVNQGIYAFDVQPSATKPEIKRAVEEIFKVHVTAVNTTKVYAKERGRGRFRGMSGGGKKALVHLRPGDKIDLFESGVQS